ncbi:MAG: DUF2461 domain-containing protein [Chloroflexota bacterium]|nr:DUF2461 domain-containing protein [Chloroflexota bacterium]
MAIPTTTREHDSAGSNAPPFSGFSRDAIQFLVELAENNERAWFQPRKADYERLLRQPMEALCVALAEQFAGRGIPLQADPKRSPFRIYRDARFSRNKLPYKTNLAATFPWLGADGAAAGGAADADDGGRGRPHGNGGYFNFQPGEMYFGGGMWMPARPRLEAFRRAVRDEPERVRTALEDPAFVAAFGGAHTHEMLKRVPVGYPIDHPLAELFRWKDVIFGRRLSDSEVLSPTLPDVLADGYASAVPVFRFLATLSD